MKSIFDRTTRDELISRIYTLNENSKAQFGTMNVAQMMRHCILYEEWILGKNPYRYKQSFLGRLFGKSVLKDVLKDDSPLKQNMPTVGLLKVKENSYDLITERKNWIARIEEFEHFSNHDFIHSFFGKMTKEQIGYLDYKHSDHHLRQFNA
ncbi:MAG: DUF1569 domain-containing protein [Pricia sp.]|nr:DUF1569 domain-containing protein [Pricia sp.]